MLKINSASRNYDGFSEINDEPIVNINGSITEDSLYINVNATNVTAAKANKEDVATDIAQFVETMLS